MVQRPLKADVRVDKSSSFFFTSARREPQNFFVLGGGGEASERAEGPTTGTGNEKGRTLRKSSVRVRVADQAV